MNHTPGVPSSVLPGYLARPTISDSNLPQHASFTPGFHTVRSTNGQLLNTPSIPSNGKPVNTPHIPTNGQMFNTPSVPVNGPYLTSTSVPGSLGTRGSPGPGISSSPYVASSQALHLTPNAQSTPHLPQSMSVTSPQYRVSSTAHPTSNNSTVPHMINSTHSTPGCRSSPVLLEKEILTQVRTKDSERRQSLSILLQEKINPTNHSKEIYIQVTDKLDPFLFYSLCMTEEDFQHLKASQGLLVDFSSFPGMLKQLLEKCQEEAESSSPTFILILNLQQTATSLEFTELNLFKHLCHLSVIVVKASDVQLKEYLVECIKSLQRDLGSCHAQLTSAQQQMTERQQQLEQQSSKLEAVLRKQQEANSSMGQKMVSDIQEEREKCNRRISELQNRFEVERRESESRHARSLEQLENRIASLDVQNRDLLEGKYRGESTTRELRGKLSAREEEMRRLEADLRAANTDRGNVEVRNREDSRRIEELLKRIHNLEEEARHGERELQRARDLATQVEREKEDMAQELKEKTGTVSRRETAVRGVTEELMKANDIIRKLQDQVKQEANRAKLRGKIAAEQEKLLADKDKDLNEARDKLQEALQGTGTKNKQLEEKEDQVRQLEEKNEQLDKINRSNENVINWLNKQLASFKSTENIVANTTSGRGKGRGAVSARRTDAKFGPTKENEPVIGLDAKYFEHSTPGGSKARSQIPDVTELPTNVKRGGLLRK